MNKKDATSCKFQVAAICLHADEDPDVLCTPENVLFHPTFSSFQVKSLPADRFENAVVRCSVTIEDDAGAGVAATDALAASVVAGEAPVTHPVAAPLAPASAPAPAPAPTLAPTPAPMPISAPAPVAATQSAPLPIPVPTPILSVVPHDTATTAAAAAAVAPSAASEDAPKITCLTVAG